MSKVKLEKCLGKFDVAAHRVDKVASPKYTYTAQPLQRDEDRDEPELSGQQRFQHPRLIQRLEHYMNKFDNNIIEVEHDKELKFAELISARQNQGLPFPQIDLLNAFSHDSHEVIRELQFVPEQSRLWKPQRQTRVAVAAQI